MKKALNLFEKRIVMSATNPIITTPEEQFVVGESDFAFFGNYASRCEGGAILYCRKGSADATVNQYCGQVRRNTLILVLPGSLLMLTNRTEDFRMTFCAFSRDLFAEAGVPSARTVVFPDPARKSDHLSARRVSWRRRQYLVSDGRIHLPRPQQCVPQYDYPQPPAERAAGDLRQIAALRQHATADARNDDAPDGAFPPFRRAGARTQFAAARGVVLCRQTLHFHPLSLDHRAHDRA